MAPIARRAQHSDLVSLVSLRVEMFAAMGVAGQGTQWRENAYRWFQDRLDNPLYCITVVQVADRVVACAMGAIRDTAPSPSAPLGREIIISNVCTDPSARGRGYASLAFEAVMEWARSSGIDGAQLLATNAGESIYRRAGFTRSKHPLMRIQLTAKAIDTTPPTEACTADQDN